MRRTDETQFNSEDDLGGHKVALVEGDSFSQSVLEEHPDVAPVLVKTAAEGLFALATGKADAYVGVQGSNFYLAQNRGISNLEVASLYGAGTDGQRFGIRKDWPELASILDKALDAMPEEEKSALFARWLPAQVTPSKIQTPSLLPLTSEEQIWLAEHPEIKVGVMDSWPPMDYVDDQGKPIGIGAKFIEAMNKRLDGVLELQSGPGLKSIQP